MSTFSGQFVAVCYAIFFCYWIVAAFFAKRTAERQGRWGRSTIIAVAVLFLLLFISRRAIPTSAGSRLWADSPAIAIAAVLATATGLIILLWARVILAGNWSADVVLKENHELIVRGPYRHVRHPIYTGIILMALGGVLLWGTTTALALMFLLPAFLWRKLLQEERLMTQHFPDAYPLYRARVKALVPFVI